MAGSRRKAKKSRSKVKVGLPKRKNKAPRPNPLMLPGTKEVLEWDIESTLHKNYLNSGFRSTLHNVIPSGSSGSEGRGESAVRGEGMGSEQEEGEEERPGSGPEDEESEEDDEIRAAVGKKRKKTPGRGLDPLTKMQQVHVGALINKYGDDYQAMMRDTKLNRVQHSAGALHSLCKRFHAFKYKLP